MNHEFHYNIFNFFFFLLRICHRLQSPLHFLFELDKNIASNWDLYLITILTILLGTIFYFRRPPQQNERDSPRSQETVANSLNANANANASTNNITTSTTAATTTTTSTVTNNSSGNNSAVNPSLSPPSSSSSSSSPSQSSPQSPPTTAAVNSDQ